MAPISNETHITPNNVSGLTDEEIKVVLEESKRRQSETATTLDQKEKLSQAPRWTGKLYHDPEAPEDGKTDESRILNRKYIGVTYTYVIFDSIEQVLQKQDIGVKDFYDEKEATAYMKEMFRDYQDKFPELRKKDNWFDLNQSMLYKTLLGPNGVLKNIPYAGCKHLTDGWMHSGNSSYIRLPLRIFGRSVYLWSNGDSQEARFGYGGEGTAFLAASFED